MSVIPLTREEAFRLAEYLRDRLIELGALNCVDAHVVNPCGVVIGRFSGGFAVWVRVSRSKADLARRVVEEVRERFGDKFAEAVFLEWV